MTADTYYTIQKPAVYEIKIKGSRFIGQTALSENRDAADFFVRDISKKHHDATHNCFAYRIGTCGHLVFRFSDDGEPSGTAGKPILEAIDHIHLTQTVCVVTRYFGGTKLGTGGLARAYRTCAAETLNRSGIKTNHLMETVTVEFDYSLTGPVMALITHMPITILDTRYDEKTRLKLNIRRSSIETFEKEFTNTTAGKATLKREESTHY